MYEDFGLFRIPARLPANHHSKWRCTIPTPRIPIYFALLYLYFKLNYLNFISLYYLFIYSFSFIYLFIYFYNSFYLIIHFNYFNFYFWFFFLTIAEQAKPAPATFAGHQPTTILLSPRIPFHHHHSPPSYTNLHFLFTCKQQAIHHHKSPPAITSNHNQFIITQNLQFQLQFPINQFTMAAPKSLSAPIITAAQSELGIHRFSSTHHTQARARALPWSPKSEPLLNSIP